jgi:GntR family uxuAB operon transcriptional repressor
MNQPIKIGAAEVASLLRRDILDGVRSFKDRLPSERDLAATHGVARGTVREALNRLADDGLIEIKRGSGAYVSYQDEVAANSVVANARPLELIDARFALEPHICRLAVLHARPSDLDHAEAILSKMEQDVENHTQFAENDKAFHSLLAEITGNSLLIWIMAQINTVRGEDQWAQMRQITLDPQMIATYNLQHRQILNAIKTREAERAAVLMKEHLESARTSLTRAIAT